MGKAIIKIETYNDGKSTRINYIPDDINSYTVIGVLRQLLHTIERHNDKTQTMMQKKVK